MARRHEVSRPSPAIACAVPSASPASASPRILRPSKLLSRDEDPPVTLDARVFVARVLAHIPDRRRQLVHYYGAYSNVVRGKQEANRLAHAPPPSPPADPVLPLSPSAAALRRRWRELIRRVYEVDPLVCPRCRDVMRVVAFITARSLIRGILDHLSRRASQGRDPPP